MGWPLETAPCILNKKSAKFYLKILKTFTKTIRVKEIMKQLKEVS